MIYRILIISILFIGYNSNAQTATEIVKKSYNQFKKLTTYTSDVKFMFDIPGVNIKNNKGKIFYKSPDKYRVKLDGIAFIPNENPMKIYSYLSDQKKYSAILNSSEIINGQDCYIINIIPNGEADFILGKLWISKTFFCPNKVELSTRKGTVKIENHFNKMASYGLPDKVVFFLENFKAPKAKGLGPKKETTKEEKTGTITMLYTNYKVNVPIADSNFIAVVKKKK